ncbi:MAG: AAA family ATPase, partial [Vampirovibrionia bacterium]
KLPQRPVKSQIQPKPQKPMQPPVKQRPPQQEPVKLSTPQTQVQKPAKPLPPKEQVTQPVKPQEKELPKVVENPVVEQNTVINEQKELNISNLEVVRPELQFKETIIAGKKDGEDQKSPVKDDILIKDDPILQQEMKIEEPQITESIIPLISEPVIKEQNIEEMPVLEQVFEESKQEFNLEAKKPLAEEQEPESEEELQSFTLNEEAISIEKEEDGLIPYNKPHIEESNIVEEDEEEEPSQQQPQKSEVAVEKPKEPLVKKELTKFAVVSLEIINYSSLLQKLEPHVVNNIKDRLWSIISETVTKCGEKLNNVSENACMISFAHSDNKQNSSIIALQAAAQILINAGILNEQLQTVLNTELKIKMGVAFNDADGFSQIERSIASAWSIVVSEDIKDDTQDLFEFDTIGPLPIGNQMVTYYKCKVSDQPGQFLNDQMNSMPNDIPADVSGDHSGSATTKTLSSTVNPVPDIKTKICDKTTVVNNLMNACSLADSSKMGQFVSIIAEDGLGKSSSIRELKASLSPQSFIWLVAKCNYQEKNMPLATVKTLLRNFLGLPDIVHNRTEVKNIIKKSLSAIPGINEQVLHVVNALLLNEELSGLNKSHIITSLFSVIRGITEKATVIVVIEDMDAIDNTSMEIIEALLEARLLDNKVVFIATFHPNLNFVEAKPNLVRFIKYSQMAIPPLPVEMTPQIIENIVQTPIELPDTIMNQIIQISNGVPFITENALFLMYELGVIVNTEQGPVFNQEAAQWELPHNIQEILRLRLHRLSQVNPNAFMIMQLAATLGPKFSVGALKDLTMLGKDFDEHMQFLSSLGYFILEDTNMMIFKHNTIWELMYYSATPNEAKAQNHMHILNYLEQTIQAGGSVDLPYLAFHAENAGK